MQDSFVTIIAVSITIIVIFVVPMISLSNQNDVIANDNVQTIIDEFITDVRTTGKLSMDKYEMLESKLLATGIVYDIQLELQVLDENPAKKTSQTTYTKIGENVYYIEYTTQILQELGETKLIELKEGDIISAKIQNKSSTIYSTLKNNFLKSSRDGIADIVGQASGMVIVNGVKSEITK